MISVLFVFIIDPFNILIRF